MLQKNRNTVNLDLKEKTMFSYGVLEYNVANNAFHKPYLLVE